MTEQIYDVTDIKPVPDLKATDYASLHGSQGTAIVIDHGSYNVRVGWADEEEPRLQFPTIAGKSRSRKDTPTYAGHDALAYLTGRNLCRPSMEGGLIVAWDLEEAVLDHAFRCLGITGSSVEHPVLMSEAVCNPNICRGRMSELLFELYGVPQVSYGIDALFSLYHNQPTIHKQGTSLVLSSGNHGSYVLPFVNGRLRGFDAKRIDIGGEHLHQYAMRLFNIRQPFLKTELTFERTKQIVAEHTYFALDYQEMLTNLENPQTFDKFSRRLQLPLNLESVPTEEQLADKARRRLEQADRMKDMHRKRQVALLKASQEKLQTLEQSITPLYGLSGDDFVAQLVGLGLKSIDELAKSWDELHFKVHKADVRLNHDGNIPVPDLRLEVPVHNANTVDGPIDPEWPESVLRLRNHVLLVRDLQSKLQACRVETLKAEQANTKRLSTQDEERRTNPIAWANSLRAERAALLQELEQNKKIRQELSDRRSGAAKARMRLVVQQTQLSKPATKKAKGPKGAKQPYRNKETEDDDFGVDDNDWAVYSQINLKEDQGDDSELEERLAVIDTQLEEYEAQRAKENPETRDQILARMKGELQFELGVEQVQVPELVFQPAMMGVDQTGIGGAMEFVFPRFTADEQLALAENIFVTGGLARIPNFTERVRREAVAMRPFGSVVKVYEAQDPVLDAWRGMKDWLKQSSSSEGFFTKLEYEEMGAGYLAEHFASNAVVEPRS
eukprot:m.158761 g.158761  ORF g.158761 m.158761 type:complete len:727 (-) comp16474_c0_seq1:2731-4911(-)